MIGNLRTLLGGLLIKAGMMVLEPNVRKLVIRLLMFHVPGALTDEEKSEIRADFAAWKYRDVQR